MGKREEFNRGYSAGLLTANDIVKKEGQKALEDEIKFRNITKVRIPLTAKEIDAGTGGVKNYVVQTIGIVAMMALRNEYDWGKKRLRRFLNRFKLDTECLMEKDLVSWEDYIDTLLEETGIDLRKEWDKTFLEET